MLKSFNSILIKIIVLTNMYFNILSLINKNKLYISI